MTIQEIQVISELCLELIKTLTSPQLVALYVLLLFRSPISQLLSTLKGKDLRIDIEKKSIEFIDGIKKLAKDEKDPDLFRELVIKLTPELLSDNETSSEKSAKQRELDAGNEDEDNEIEDTDSDNGEQSEDRESYDHESSIINGEIGIPEDDKL